MNSGLNKISVGVICYNSESTIIETLDSIKEQDFDLDAVEIIISDDGSSDNSVKLAEEWSKKHRSNFSNVSILKGENLGISGNCNRVIDASSSEYIKIIAADDLLDSVALREYYSYATDNNTTILFSKTRAFSGTKSKSWSVPLKSDCFFMTAEEQLQELTFGNFMPAPAAFIHNAVFKELNGYENKYRLIEDLPFWIRALKSGYVSRLIDRELVFHRSGGESDIPKKNVYNLDYEYMVLDVLTKELKSELLIVNKFMLGQDILVRKTQLFISKNFFGNKRSKISLIVCKLIGVLSFVKIYNFARGITSYKGDYILMKMKKIKSSE